MENAIEKIKATALSDARSSLGHVQSLLEITAGIMAEIHGGDWGVHIDHENGLVMIVPKPARVSPRRGEAA